MLPVFFISAFDCNMETATMQRTAMTKLISMPEKDVPSNYLTKCNLIQYPECDPSEVCLWNGVECINGTVFLIRWRGSKQKLVCNLHWVPNTVEELVLTSVGVDSPLRTRRLPRRLRRCKIYMCDLEGSVELRTLPSRLEDLNLRANGLTGIVNLTELPAALAKVDMSLNGFPKMIVRNTSLPKGLLHAYFNQPGKKLKIVELDGKKLDERVHTKGDMYDLMTTCVFDDNSITSPSVTVDTSYEDDY